MLITPLPLARLAEWYEVAINDR